MIFDSAMGLVLDGAAWVLSLLPEATPLSLDGISTAVGMMLTWDAALPVHEMLVMAAAFVALRSSQAAAGIVIAIYKLLPFKFT